MKIISAVSIEGFRSIANETADALGAHTVFIGKNSGGKSNVLRALNVFFNGESSPGVPIDLERDLHFRPLRRQKKQIRVAVTFSLSGKLYFRRELSGLRDLGESFRIEKIWSLDRQRRVAESVRLISNEVEVSGGDALARDFLSLIVFRYIPNRTIPAELLRDESQAIAGVIFKKLRESGQAADVLRGLGESAARLLQSTSAAMQESGAPIHGPNVALANSLGGMLRMSGFQASGLNGASVRDEDWGSGHQAYFLLNLLREIDTDYSRQFGWRQASVWAVEEPESGLHHDLQTRLAKQFIDWTADENRRLQVFTTSHSPVIAMSADAGYWVELGSTSSQLESMPIDRLARAAEEQGVSTYLHPVLAFPFNPVVLVEGPHDEAVLSHVASITGRSVLKFVSLPSLDDKEEGAGTDSILTYLRRNRELISRRGKDCPLIVLVDWETPDAKLHQLRQVYGLDGQSYVVRANPANCPQELGKSFKGLERFYCLQVLRRAHDLGEISIAFPANSASGWSVEKNELIRAKARLAARMREVSDLKRLAPLISVVEQVFEASVSYANQQLKLV